MCSQDETVPLERLEQQITELASQIHADTCRWLCLVAEYDAREGWAQWGCRSCAHWVSWRCGVAPGAAREHVRVARRLTELPLIREAFAAGRLSYSKVRALTRVGGIAREQELLDLARHATAGQLERLVRAYRGIVAAETAQPERWLTWDYADDGSVLLRGRLPAEEGALVIAALEAARDEAREAERVSAETPAESPPAESSPTPEDVSAETPGPTAGEACADALVLMAESLLAHGTASRTAGDRYQVVVHVDEPTLRSGARGERCETDAGAPLAARTAMRLACDASLVTILERDGQPLDVGRKTRTIPPALRRALNARDRGCRFPGCTARHFIDAHHIEHWARGGPTKLGNLVQLCRHHHRLLHEGGYRVDRRGDGRLAFRRPDGRHIPACPAPPDASAGRLRRRDVEPEACVSLSAGDHLDLDLGVAAMLAFAPPPATAEPLGV
jgi:Domain of unknown function (DUF222)